MGLLAVLFFVFLNGFFVATEFALVAVRRTKMQELASDGNTKAGRVLHLLDHLDTYIAATQLGITMASLALGWIGEPALAHLIKPLVAHIPLLPANADSAAAHSISVIIAFALITSLHIVLGELAPKSLALERPEATSLWAERPLHAFHIIFRPIIAVLNGVGNAVVRLFGIDPAASHARVQSTEELMLALDASHEAGVVTQETHELVDRAFSFSRLAVRQVMVPRTEMVAVPVDTTFETVIRVAAESGHMRLPVYEHDTDHIVGVLYVKRFLHLLMPGHHEAARFSIPDYMVEPLIVPESVPAADVLARLRQTRTQLAIVIDEYGGTAGITTLEDLVERVVGNINDVLAPATAELPQGDGSYLLDGLTSLQEAKDEQGLDLTGPDYDVETVGGFVFAALGRQPTVGDEVQAPNGERLRIESLDGLRVERVRVQPVACCGPPADPVTLVTLDKAPNRDPSPSLS